MADGLHPTNPNRSMRWTKHDETTFEAKDAKVKAIEHIEH